jgi:hypothetical protein
MQSITLKIPEKGRIDGANLCRGLVSTVEPHFVHLPLRIVLRDSPSCADPELTLCLPCSSFPSPTLARVIGWGGFFGME